MYETMTSSMKNRLACFILLLFNFFIQQNLDLQEQGHLFMGFIVSLISFMVIRFSFCHLLLFFQYKSSYRQQFSKRTFYLPQHSKLVFQLNLCCLSKYQYKESDNFFSIIGIFLYFYHEHFVELICNNILIFKSVQFYESVMVFIATKSEVDA